MSHKVLFRNTWLASWRNTISNFDFKTSNILTWFARRLCNHRLCKLFNREAINEHTTGILRKRI